MAKRKPIQIGDEIFPTKAAAERRIRELVNAAALHEPLTGEEHRFVAALLALHPDAKHKIGPGVRHFHVRINRVQGKPNRGLWITRIDGTEIDFSWGECLKPTPHPQKVKNAMRAAVQPDMLAFKQEAFGDSRLSICSLTTELIAFTEAEVHHDPPFDELARAFTGGRYDEIEVDVGKSAAQFGDRLVDAELERRWIEFHRERARLILVSKDAHRAAHRA